MTHSRTAPYTLGPSLLPIQICRCKWMISCSVCIYKVDGQPTPSVNAIDPSNEHFVLGYYLLHIKKVIEITYRDFDDKITLFDNFVIFSYLIFFKKITIFLRKTSKAICYRVTTFLRRICQQNTNHANVGSRRFGTKEVNPMRVLRRNEPKNSLHTIKRWLEIGCVKTLNDAQSWRPLYSFILSPPPTPTDSLSLHLLPLPPSLPLPRPDPELEADKRREEEEGDVRKQNKKKRFASFFF